MFDMSKKSLSLDLTEYFDNEESNGDRLAEYLQERRGVVQCPKLMFGESEPLRLSVDVQLENIPNADQKEDDQTKEKAKAADCQTPNAILAAEECNKGGQLTAAEYCEKIFKPNTNPPQKGRIPALRKSGLASPSDRLRRYSLNRRSGVGNGRRPLLKEFESTMSLSDFSPRVCSTPITQQANKPETAARPTANVENIAPNNSLVNNTPKVASKDGNISLSAGCGKATEDQNQSLQEIMESIVKTTLKSVQSQIEQNFEKTKTLEIEPEKSATNSRTYTLEKGNKPGQVILTPNIALSTNSSAMEVSDCAPQNRRRSASLGAAGPSSDNAKNCIHITHQIFERSRCSRNGEQVDIPNTTQLEHGRSYVGNDGHNLCNAKGFLTDMDITPLLTHAGENVTLRSIGINKTAHDNVPSNPKHTTNHAQVTICFDSPENANLSKTEKKKINTRGKKPVVLIKNLKSTGDKTLSDETSDMNMATRVLPALQDNNSNATKLVFRENGIDEILSEEELVIPETQQTELTPERQTVHNEVGSPCRPSSQSNVPNRSMCYSLKSPVVNNNDEMDKLKLSDILTDDEDEPNHSTTISQTFKALSSVPLNLTERKKPSQRLRKATSPRLRVENEMTEDMLNKTQTEPMPLSLSHRALNRKQSFKRSKIPLNKAPGAALNGEQFAKELARMSNYEIIDLRKNNSMGKVFAKSGRKSTLEREEARKKQAMLDEEIDMELLRRNIELSEIAADSESQKALAEMNKEADKHESATVYLPAPQEFCDSVLPQMPASPSSESSLVNERPCDRVSFRKKTSVPKLRKSNKKPDILINYLEVSKKFTKAKRATRTENPSKRLLYSREADESIIRCNEKHSIHIDTEESLPCVPSPPASDTDEMAEVRVVSPPPPLSRSLKSLQNMRAQKTVESSEIESLTLLEPIPPPPSFESDSGVAEHQKDDHVFKIPLQPPPKKKRRGRSKQLEKADSVVSSSETAITESSETDKTDEGSLRRSKREHVPLKYSVPLIQLMYQNIIDKRNKSREKSILKNKEKEREIAKANKKIMAASSTSSDRNEKSTTLRQEKRQPTAVVSEITVPDSSTVQSSLPAKGKKKTAEKRATRVSRKAAKVRTDEKLECSRVTLTAPPPLDHFNNVFDQLRNLSNVENRNSEKQTHNSPVIPSVKKLRVRVARIKTSDKMKEGNAYAQSSTSQSTELMTSENITTESTETFDNNRANVELISWLKNITEAECTASNDAILNEMRISSRSNLSFTELQGIEYAFYDTEDQASLGYLRFKPRQIKPRKRAKRYHLHFVVLDGKFRITANDKERVVERGDMVAIKKSIYYDIENITDDIGILMVIKK